MFSELYDEALRELQRKGALEKVKALKSLGKTIMPSLKKRIQENDKTVLNELFLPKWINWNLLYSWAIKDLDAGEKRCALCGNASRNGTDFRQKFICEACLIEIKSR